MPLPRVGFGLRAGCPRHGGVGWRAGYPCHGLGFSVLVNFACQMGGVAYLASMNALEQRITEDMKTAMRAKDQVSLIVIRSLKAGLQNAAIERGGAGAELDDLEVMAVVRKQIKQRQDSVEQYNNANRPELAEKEVKEIEVLEKYLPQPLSDAELDEIVDLAVAAVGATSMADMGKVMGEAGKLAAGRADGKTLSQKVRAKLG